MSDNTPETPTYCNECGRTLKHSKDVEEIPTVHGSFSYGVCQYCRAKRTKRANKWKAEAKRALEGIK